MKSADPIPSPKDAHVVFLVNFVAPNLIAVCQQIASRVGKFTVLSSVAMESNRDWKTEWGDLDVRVQKTWTITRHPKHPGGYQEVNYIHIPLDTLSQLRRLNPDVVVSLELGARTAWSTLYRTLHRQCVHVTTVYASERSESGRGRLRGWLRRRLLRRAPWVTYNGPSCKRLLESFGADPDRMSPWNYAADPNKAYRGPLTPRGDRSSIQLLTVGQLSERKGILPALEQLSKWAIDHPENRLHWNVVGNGPQLETIKAATLPENLTMTLHGHCCPDQIAAQYRDNDMMLFPTLADEWGLVVDESLQSGLPVIGSLHSQSVTTLLTDGIEGMVYDPEVPTSLADALDRLMAMSDEAYARMPSQARQVGETRTPEASAQQFVDAVAFALAAKHVNSKNESRQQPDPVQR
ncbi:D-inositol 3-phosphate glycosyltransferase [Rubripirellula tenax]|uniref:D-inositol 3-phosphate glycosyltransferase n=1 Tax=Rubripirellula tenax TaxID=2528015 RepID=A0A5C6FG13_9BACT|nr:glycosyltransferase family 4 protein [Rubripirellula tenax]TWU59440.1 D-inositol 3-phosphate glycosyltransferase [Rubripirellula tenax]